MWKAMLYWLFVLYSLYRLSVVTILKDRLASKKNSVTGLVFYALSIFNSCNF